MITTKNFQLTPKEFFLTLIKVYLKKRWWYFPLIWTFAVIFSLNDGVDSFAQFYVLFSIIYPIVLLYKYWAYANSKDNKIFLIERYFDIYEDRLVGFLSDGTENTIKTEHFIKLIDLENMYLLYIAKTQFIFIPKDSFKKEQDKEWFEKNIVAKIKS